MGNIVHINMNGRCQLQTNANSAVNAEHNLHYLYRLSKRMRDSRIGSEMTNLCGENVLFFGVGTFIGIGLPVPIPVPTFLSNQSVSRKN